MAIALSQNDYWALVQESTDGEQSGYTLGNFDTTWKYPSQLGCGFVREIDLREGLELTIADYQLYDDIIIYSSDHEHPLECNFRILGKSYEVADTIPYYLYGSGISPGEHDKELANQRIMWVSVHIEPDVFRSFTGNPDEDIPTPLQHLIGDPNHEYYSRLGQTTPAMQVALQQILHCPYRGFTQRMFLESKVWELMALLLEQETEASQNQSIASQLKPDDIERIHHAKAILLQHLNDPPSLAQLARQVGLNECTLKRGFRQVFGTTAFGYLHHYRLEQARQLLMNGEMTVAQVAQSIGFARNYFTRAFAQKFGCPPGAYRKQQRILTSV